jgi:hypothetical protein
LEIACRDPDEPASTETEKIFRLAEIPEKIRIVITTRDASHTALPVGLELAQAVSGSK